MAEGAVEVKEIHQARDSLAGTTIIVEKAKVVVEAEAKVEAAAKVEEEDVEKVKESVMVKEKVRADAAEVKAVARRRTPCVSITRIINGSATALTVVAASTAMTRGN